MDLYRYIPDDICCDVWYFSQSYHFIKCLFFAPTTSAFGRLLISNRIFSANNQSFHSIRLSMICRFYIFFTFSNRIFSANNQHFGLSPFFQNPPFLYKPFCMYSIIFPIPFSVKWPSPTFS